ncbi:hypothetical protein BJ165DRAFT_1512820 [Panaeolus papilionaceus]|nr:hypothetical protein BJ165DRAFT_1512820 [Panaeolus papilionaceus]
MSDDLVRSGTEIIPVFPVEIFSEILDQLGFEQRKKGRRLPTIIACSLTCTTLASLSRAHIFQAITFGPYGSRKGQPHGLAILLKEKPHLANCVQRATFIVDPNLIEPRMAGDHSDTLHELLPNVVSFRIRPPIYYSSWMHSTPHEDFAQRAIENYAKNHHLYRLSIGNVTAPMWTILSRNSYLTTLSISSCSLKQWELANVDMEVVDPKIFPKITDLSLFDVDNLSHSMLCYFPSLTHLCVVGCRNNVEADPEFLHRYQPRQNPALKHLQEMQMSCAFPLMDACHNATAIDTCAFPALTSLRIGDCDSDYSDSERVSSLNIILQHVNSLVSLDMCIANIHDAPLDLMTCFTACKSTLSNVVLRSSGDGSAEPDFYDTHVKALCTGLDAIRADNVMEAITLELDFFMDDILVKETPLFNDWRRLEELILRDRSINFSKLQFLDVTVKMYDPSVDHKDSGDKLSPTGVWIRGPFLLKPLEGLLAGSVHQSPYSHRLEGYGFIQEIHIDF